MAERQETIADIIAEMRHKDTARRRFTLTDAFGGYETITIDRANTMLSLADRLEAAHKRERGNSAVMYAALMKVKKLFDGQIMFQPAIREAHEAVNAALAAPPRNCDVGSAEGQYARFVAVCHANVDLTGRCRESCPFRRVPAEYKCDRAECFARWAQLPYKEGGAK